MKTARVWDASAGTEKAVLMGHEDTVNSAAFSPDGTKVVTASNDKTARVWDTATGAKIGILKKHRYQIGDGYEGASAAFSPDGTRVVIATSGGTASVWATATGAEMAQLDGHRSSVKSVAFSPDGTRILTASEDGSARVWDAATGAEVAILGLGGQDAFVHFAMFSRDGTKVTTASDELRVWDLIKLEKGDGFAVACQRLGVWNRDLAEVRARYRLGEITPICGDYSPVPVDPRRVTDVALGEELSPVNQASAPCPLSERSGQHKRTGRTNRNFAEATTRRSHCSQRN